MPELPEVETIVRTLVPHLTGRRVADLCLPDPACLEKCSMPLQTALGTLIRSVTRRGKFVVLCLDARDGTVLYLVVHLRMTGRLIVCGGVTPAPQDVERRVRLVLRLADADRGLPVCRLLFSDVRRFGRVFLGDADALAAWPSWARLGPEPLDMDEDAFALAVRGSRAVKVVLLDQHVLAGVGNIYADESLHAAGIRPDTPANMLSQKRKYRLLRELKRILQLSIEECGSSIRDYQDADGNVGAFQNHFHVYGRGGKACPDCGAVLRRIMLGGRGTVYCPRCQRH